LIVVTEILFDSAYLINVMFDILKGAVKKGEDIHPKSSILFFAPQQKKVDSQHFLKIVL